MYDPNALDSYVDNTPLDLLLNEKEAAILVLASEDPAYAENHQELYDAAVGKVNTALQTAVTEREGKACEVEPSCLEPATWEATNGKTTLKACDAHLLKRIADEDGPWTLTEIQQ